MKTIKVSEATNTQLDWLVATCEGYQAAYTDGNLRPVFRRNAPVESTWPAYTTDPALMVPIIDRELISTRPAYLVGTSESGEEVHQHKGWAAHPPSKHYWQTPPWGTHGETMLIAAARCYVVSKLGMIVKVPEELL